MSKERGVALDFEGRALEGVLVSRRDNQRRPAVILFPTIAGVSELEIGFGRDLVHLGYSAFVADLYGKQFRGADRDVLRGEMNALLADRALLRRLVNAVLEHVRGLDEVEEDAIAVAGYCFGGLCALDLARSGADIAGAASFHGLFDPPTIPNEPIKARIIAFHGWDDPLVPPAKVEALGAELTAAGADWQIHAYGGIGHAFTNPKATGLGPGFGYSAIATERSWSAFVNFLEEVLGGHD